MSAAAKIKLELDRVAEARAHSLVYSWATELQKLEAIDVSQIEARKAELRTLISDGQALLRDGLQIQAEIPKRESPDLGPETKEP